MKKILTNLVNILTFGLKQDTDEILNLTKEIHDIQKRDKEDIQSYALELERQRMMSMAVLNQLDDMVWAKDLSGKYLMCNDTFRTKFCYSLTWQEIKGKTDLELSKIFKDKVGDENHTFGEVCQNSDLIVAETQDAMQFLEHGLIGGNVLKLVVNKSPMYDFEGIMYGICGTGRDVTEWHNGLERAIDANTECLGKEGAEILKQELNKLEFKG